MIETKLETQWSYSVISLCSTHSLWIYELFPKGWEVKKNHKRQGGTGENRI